MMPSSARSKDIDSQGRLTALTVLQYSAPDSCVAARRGLRCYDVDPGLHCNTLRPSVHVKRRVSCKSSIVACIFAFYNYFHSRSRLRKNSSITCENSFVSVLGVFSTEIAGNRHKSGVGRTARCFKIVLLEVEAGIVKARETKTLCFRSTSW